MKTKKYKFLSIISLTLIMFAFISYKSNESVYTVNPNIEIEATTDIEDWMLDDNYFEK